MVLTKQGKQILKNFQRQYGKKKGRENFYKYIYNFPKRTKTWHK